MDLQCEQCGSFNPDTSLACNHCGETLSGAVTRVSGSHKKVVPDASSEPAPGHVLANRYTLLERIDRGGMGVVYRALDSHLNEELALKLLHPHLTEEPEQLERFKGEILTARKISHENVIRIHDFGMWENELFITMELLPSGHLGERLKNGALEVGEGLDICIQLADGLQAAHKNGVVHRDVKPANVMFDRSGRVKIADFGIARVSDSTSHTVGFVGTPNYMSPEQTYNGSITPRTDVYALGVLMFHIFTGQLPFRGQSLLEMANLHAEEPPPHPRDINPVIGVDLEAVILRCLEKAPEDRYATAGEVADDLRAVRKERPLVHGGVSELGDTSSDRSELPVVKSMPRRIPWTLILVGVLLLAGSTGITWWWTNHNSTSTASATPTAGPTAEPVKEVDFSALSTPTPRPTPRSTPRQTPRPATTRAVSAGTPTPAPQRAGKLTVTARPWVSVWIGNKRIARSTPLLGYRLPAGRHTIRLVNSHNQVNVSRTVTIVPGKTTHIQVNVQTREVKISTR